MTGNFKTIALKCMLAGSGNNVEGQAQSRSTPAHGVQLKRAQSNIIHFDAAESCNEVCCCTGPRIALTALRPLHCTFSLVLNSVAPFTTDFLHPRKVEFCRFYFRVQP